MDEWTADEWKQDDIDRYLVAVETRVSSAPLIAAVARRDIDRLIAYVRGMKHGLVTIWWLVHGSTEGRESSLRRPIEDACREALTESPALAQRPPER